MTKSPRKSPLRGGRRTAEERTRPKCDGEEDVFTTTPINPVTAIRLLQNGKYWCFDVINLSKWLKIRNSNPFTGLPFSDEQLKKVHKKFFYFEKITTAAVHGKLEIVKYLISKGADVNKTNDNNQNMIVLGDTALIQASLEGHLEIVRVLIAAGADVNKVNTQQSSALMYASYKGHIDIVRALIAAGANVNYADHDGHTALIQAVHENYSGKTKVDVVREIISAGANVNAKTLFGDSALMIASGNGEALMVNALLLAGADVNTANSSGQTALINASRAGHAQIVRALILASADVRMKSNGKTALGWAKHYNHPSVITLLKAAGAK